MKVVTDEPNLPASLHSSPDEGMEPSPSAEAIDVEAGIVVPTPTADANDADLVERISKCNLIAEDDAATSKGTPTKEEGEGSETGTAETVPLEIINNQQPENDDTRSVGSGASELTEDYYNVNVFHTITNRITPGDDSGSIWNQVARYLVIFATFGAILLLHFLS